MNANYAMNMLILKYMRKIRTIKSNGSKKHKNIHLFSPMWNPDLIIYTYLDMHTYGMKNKRKLHWKSRRTIKGEGGRRMSKSLLSLDEYMIIKLIILYANRNK